MADDPVLAERVRRALHEVPGLEERRMFGSVGFLVTGTLRIAVGTHPDHVAMVRTGPADAEALALPGAKRAVMRGKPMAGWVFLERQAIASDEQIFFWTRMGLAAV